MSEKYEQIIQKFSEDMMAVDAPIPEYIEALKEAVSELKTMINAAEEDLNREEE